MTRLPDSYRHPPAGPDDTHTAPVQAAKAARADLDAAWLRLACAAPQHTLNPHVRPEVDRRAVLFGDQQCAVESVLNDIITGRWIL